jgi:hypothetical protein
MTTFLVALEQSLSFAAPAVSIKAERRTGHGLYFNAVQTLLTAKEVP